MILFFFLVIIGIVCFSALVKAAVDPKVMARTRVSKNLGTCEDYKLLELPCPHNCDCK